MNFNNLEYIIAHASRIWKFQQKRSYTGCDVISHRKVKAVPALALICAMGASAPAFGQTEMTAGSVMERMEPEKQFAYIAGVVEGLAYARYVSDGQTTDGMQCINDWFYRQDGALAQVHDAFAALPEYPPGAVLAVLLEQVCE